MSKIRNSLGLLVLPSTYNELTWEAYKEKYGIDLHSIVDVSSGEPTLKPSISKVLVMDQSDACGAYGYNLGDNCLRLALINSITTTSSGGGGVAHYDLILGSNMFSIVIRHTVYEDNSEPDEFTIQTDEN